MNCLITGGAGHIGSHLALRLHEEGHDVDIIDNLSISKKDAIQDMINQGWEGEFVNADLRKPETVSELLQKKKYDVCFHLAGYTVPEDSKEKPIVYYENNISPFPQFLSSLIFHNVGRLVICSNYDTVTPYGLCSGVVERMIKEVSETTPHLKYSCFMLPEVVGNNIDGKIGDYGFEKKNKLIPNCMSASAKLKVEEEDIVEEKHDPLANMKIHSNLELYFRERVFCSKMKRSERVTHLIVTMVAILDPSSRNIATDANTTPSGKKNNKKGKKKKVNIEGNDQECVLILTDESLYIMKTMDDKTLKFKDNPVFFQIAAYKFKALKQIVIGFCGQRLTLKTADGMAFVLLTRNRDKTYAILQRLPNILEIIKR